MYNNVDMAQYLLELGADVEGTNEYGQFFRNQKLS